MTPQSPPGSDALRPESATAPVTPAAIARWNRARRTVAGLLFVAVLAAGAAGAWWWSRPTVVIPPPIPDELQDDEVRQVLELARREVLAKPDSANAWGQLGMTFLAHLFDREADRCFVEAGRLNPSDPRWPYARGLMALKRSPGRALPLLREAAEASETSPTYRAPIHFQLAESLLERQEVDEAEQLFRKEWAREPGNPRAALGLGLIVLARGEDQAAQEFFNAAETSPSSRKSALNQLAALARARGDTAASVEYQRQAVSLADDTPWPDPLLDESMRLRIGQRRREREVSELEQEHRYAEAAQIFLAEIAQEPTSRACVGAGINLARLGQFDQALALLHQGLKLDPDDSQAHYTLALTLFSRAERQPNASEAKEWLRQAARSAQRATEIKPDYASAYWFWGLSLKALGDPAAAVAPLRKGVACRPIDFELQLCLGQALGDSGQEQEARTYLENAQKLDAKDPRPVQALEKLRKKKD